MSLHFAKRWSCITRTVLENRGDVYIGVLAPGGYEFAVTVLVVLAMGAVVVPLSRFYLISFLDIVMTEE